MKQILFLTALCFFSGCATSQNDVSISQDETEAYDSQTRQMIKDEGVKFRSKLEKEIKLIKDTIEHDRSLSSFDDKEQKESEENKSFYSPMYMMIKGGK